MVKAKRNWKSDYVNSINYLIKYNNSVNNKSEENSVRDKLLNDYFKKLKEYKTFSNKTVQNIAGVGGFDIVTESNNNIIDLLEIKIANKYLKKEEVLKDVLKLAIASYNLECNCYLSISGNYKYLYGYIRKYFTDIFKISGYHKKRSDSKYVHISIPKLKKTYKPSKNKKLKPFYKKMKTESIDTIVTIQKNRGFIVGNRHKPNYMTVIWEIKVK